MKTPPTLKTQKVRELDSELSSVWKIPTLLLMENAGRSLAEIFIANAPLLDNGKIPERVLLCCGKGNNGGDGFVLARRLETIGKECRVVLATRPENYRGDAKTNLDVLLEMWKYESNKLFVFDDSEEKRGKFNLEIAQCDWIVDALLGTGATGGLKEPYDLLVRALNESEKPIFSVDVPTGLNANDGSVGTIAVRARVTATLAANKIGLTLERAREYVGALFVGDIGVDVNVFLNRRRTS